MVSSTSGRAGAGAAPWWPPLAVGSAVCTWLSSRCSWGSFAGPGLVVRAGRRPLLAAGHAAVGAREVNHLVGGYRHRAGGSAISPGWGARRPRCWRRRGLPAPGRRWPRGAGTPTCARGARLLDDQGVLPGRRRREEGPGGRRGRGGGRRLVGLLALVLVGAGAAVRAGAGGPPPGLPLRRPAMIDTTSPRSSTIHLQQSRSASASSNIYNTAAHSPSSGSACATTGPSSPTSPSPHSSGTLNLELPSTSTGPSSSRWSGPSPTWPSASASRSCWRWCSGTPRGWPSRPCTGLAAICWAVPSYITALVWKGMFHRQFGALNALPSRRSGAEPVSFFGQFWTAFAPPTWRRTPGSASRS